MEIRRIGHRLEKEGGFDLMYAVATRAGDLTGMRMAERQLNHYWHSIGRWQA